MGSLERPNNREDLDLVYLAGGSSGLWDIAIDETPSGRPRWFAQIKNPSIYLYFEIESPHVVKAALQFLDEKMVIIKGNENRIGRRLDIGAASQISLSLISDYEVGKVHKWYFSLTDPQSHSTIRLSLNEQDVKDLSESLKQVQEDLEDEEQGVVRRAV